MDRLKVPGAILIAILGITVIASLFGINQFSGVVSTPPSLAPSFLQIDLATAFELSLISVVFAFLFVDLFDTAGTLIGVAHRAGLLDENGRLPRLRSALLADSLATVAGAAPRNINHNKLYREHSGHSCRWADRSHGDCCGDSFLSVSSVRPARREHSRIRDRTRAPICRLYDGARPRGN